MGLQTAGRIDDCSYWITHVSFISVSLAVMLIYPRMMAVHTLFSEEADGSLTTPIIPLTSEHITEDGIFLLENGEDALIYIGDRVNSYILDQLFGIPNTLNVVSNFPFLVIGIVGLVLCFHGNYFNLRLQGELWGWACFFIGVAAVGVGSSYYHLEPNDARLVWDRLPMTIAFTSIIAIFIIERIDEHKGTVSLIPLLLAGVVSILYWSFFDDLRPYALVQFVPCIAIPLMAILLPPMYTHSTYWLWAAGFYLLAKVEEAMDKPIYRWTHHIVSGHTLKHLCAAMVPVFLTLMLAKRTIETESCEVRCDSVALVVAVAPSVVIVIVLVMVFFSDISRKFMLFVGLVQTGIVLGKSPQDMEDTVDKA
ncbi:hypothetical protein KPL71_014333 [Citrus sinensis]|uniref:Uncharacterized protein n=1 Tax=Citrus sinensis TaxID=2711 RepID=A0ACB8KAX5_CITSI|nr:hypothetical protein KPL71_014333 [Citrus sinensis]